MQQLPNSEILRIFAYERPLADCILDLFFRTAKNTRARRARSVVDVYRRRRTRAHTRNVRIVFASSQGFYIHAHATRCRPASTLTLINAESLICMHGNDFCARARSRMLNIVPVLIAGATSVLIARETGDIHGEKIHDSRRRTVTRSHKDDDRVNRDRSTDRSSPRRSFNAHANRRSVKDIALGSGEQYFVYTSWLSIA